MPKLGNIFPILPSSKIALTTEVSDKSFAFRRVASPRVRESDTLIDVITCALNIYCIG